MDLGLRTEIINRSPNPSVNFVDYLDMKWKFVGDTKDVVWDVVLHIIMLGIVQNQRNMVVLNITTIQHSIEVVINLDSINLGIINLKIMHLCELEVRTDEITYSLPHWIRTLHHGFLIVILLLRELHRIKINSWFHLSHNSRMAVLTLREIEASR